MSKIEVLTRHRSQPGQPVKGGKPSPAQMEEMYAKFNAWREKFQKNIVDLGGKLAGGSTARSFPSGLAHTKMPEDSVESFFRGTTKSIIIVA